MSGGAKNEARLVDSGLETLIRDSEGFLLLAKLLKEMVGIDLPLTPKNMSLMASRLRKILVELGIENYGAYRDYLVSGGDAAKRRFISAMTTNTTQFFREKDHFDELTRRLPSLVDAKRRANSSEIRVWCAAASTGQEPYTILMTVLEALGEGSSLNLKFLATDIDLEVLQRAADGIYSEAEIEGVPPNLLSKYFEPCVSGRGRGWRVREVYRRMIRFAQFNLVQEPYPFQHRFDVVFCRNVLIYFDNGTAAGVVDRLARQLSPDGLLFVGHSECGLTRSSQLKTLAPAAYALMSGVHVRKERK